MTRRTWQAAAASVAIATVYILLRLPGIGIPLDRDEGVFGYMGQLINRGGLPYRDALDHKPPVAFYINALALHFVPPTAHGVHTFLLVYNFLTLICVFYVAKIYFRSLSAGLWCAFAYAVFSASPAIHAFTASTEMYAVLPATLSLLLAVCAVRSSGYALAFLSGITGAVACWTKQTSFTSVLFVLVFLAIASVTRRRDVGLWLAGAVLFSAALLAVFYWQGIFRDFIYWCFTYDLSYARVPIGDMLQRMLVRWDEIGRGDFIFPAAGMAIAVWTLIRRQGRGFFLTGFLVLSFLGTVPGYTYSHYFVQLAPAVALAGGYGFFVLLRQIYNPGLRAPVAVVCGILAVAISIGANREYFLSSDPDAISRDYFGINPFPEAATVADFLRDATKSSDRVLILGSEPEILFCARRQSATPFVMIYPLTSVHPRYREFQRTLWNEVQRAPPEYAVVVNVSTSIGWDGDADFDIIRKLQDFLAERYTVERRIPVTRPDDEIDPDDLPLGSGGLSMTVLRRNDASGDNLARTGQGRGF